MMLSMVLALAGVVTPDQFIQPLEVLQPVRLEMTPTIDGTIGKEEWDPFGQQTYLQWAPGQIYVASEPMAGKDLVLSYDTKGDGWLVGRDNLEFRVIAKDGKATVIVRELDATFVRQPVWRERKDLETASYAVVGPTGIIEAVFDDAGLGVLPVRPKDMMLRLNMADPDTDATSYQPRACVPIRFDDHRAIALPHDMDFAVQARSRAVAVTESVKLRLNFHGKNGLGAKSIEMRSLGEAETCTNRMAIVFPGFDEKGRAFVDYSTNVDSTASVGYRVVRGTIAFKDGPPAIVESSYRIAPYMDFTLRRTNVDRLPDDNILRISYVLQMYSRDGASGLVRIAPPSGWTVLKGDATKFAVLGEQSADARQMEFKVPSDAHGTFPIKITADTKTKSISQVCYVTIR